MTIEPEDMSQDTQGQENKDGQTQEPDYKALYEKAKANSRKWEKQAKANMAAASDLEGAETARKSAEERISALETLLKEKEQAEARAAIAAKVAKEKGIPADLLVGDDEESMAAYADKLLAFFKKAPAPTIDSPGSFERNEQSDNSLRDFTRQLLGTN